MKIQTRQSVIATEANISVNTNPDLDLKFEDISDSEPLEHVDKQKDQANNAYNETGRTKMSLVEDVCLDYSYRIVYTQFVIITLHICSTSVTAIFIVYL